MTGDEPSFERIASFGALVAAARRAARGHQGAPDVAGFLLELEPAVLALERELLAGKYRPQPYRTFRIRDPKPRTISAAAFRDRVVHHALCAEIEPVLERGAVASSFACRRGKGVLAAIGHVRGLVRRFPYVLKLDVRHFFETLSHLVLLRMLARRVADERIRGLIEVFVAAGAPGSEAGRGLPIGNLTSQHFANFYLGPFDRLLMRGVHAGGHCRYMDLCSAAHKSIYVEYDIMRRSLADAGEIADRRHPRARGSQHNALELPSASTVLLSGQASVGGYDMRWTQQQTRQRVQRLLDRVEPGHRGVLETFDEWLRDERCSAPATAAVRLQWVHDFLVEVVGEREVREALGQLRAGDIESYFVGCAERLSIATRRCVASTLRRFLQFAGSRGWSDANLVAAVPSVYCYSLSSVPVGISEAAIDQVISSLKPDRATHCRDKGILLLLATYGPRTGQISDLLLGDISWRERQITFCAQKRSRAVSQVLTPAVAEALALYIREYRPRVNHRHVFVNRRAPFAPLAPEAIRGVRAHAPGHRTQARDHPRPARVGRRTVPGVPHLPRHGALRSPPGSAVAVADAKAPASA